VSEWTGGKESGQLGRKGLAACCRGGLVGNTKGSSGVEFSGTCGLNTGL